MRAKLKQGKIFLSKLHYQVLPATSRKHFLGEEQEGDDQEREEGKERERRGKEGKDEDKREKYYKNGA